ncbi:zinc (Zn2)-Iron Permease [Salpingoeca rosetta]|uniref:Zinc transporter ZIP11 n=1 Tax=Salpingoeca rosetta (strain ATCC 50818 / BSB-021) TaxID=946362 RepID=F2UBZ2_SALR5|nr:zinc (Zn2)-Iron Permease [Salpingoeca rosetta]EGD74407.1 zinc (Zn2)-Iron Permease [Salpingoeca rosetta]|eukprot:XP_004993307.1 zinc (Zn2)-Iron Permease [Salpingoeca rosetta]
MENLLAAFAGTLTTWAVTALGAAVVFFAQPSQKFLDGCLGFAAGVMLAASYWSLLAPAIEIADTSGAYGVWSFVPAAVGFLFGAWFVYIADKLFPADLFMLADENKKDDDGASSMGQGGNRRQSGTASSARKNPSEGKAMRQRYMSKADLMESQADEAHGSGEGGTAATADGAHVLSSPAKRWRRTLLLAIAVTVHNIPEGLAVGVGFGSIGRSPSATFAGAWALAVGIAIQNFPEGIAVSLPLHRAGFSKWRSFWYGQLSGMVEPVAGVLGCVFVGIAEPALPFALAFAAGAMIYVVLDDIVPEVCAGPNATFANWSAMVGFVVMMSLDVALG